MRSVQPDGRPELVEASLCRLPSLRILTEGLTSVFESREHSRCEVTVLEREDNPYSSTFPSEIISCRVGGRKLRLLCKYEADRNEGEMGHRRGLGYEAEVYQSVLRFIGLSKPRFYGAYTEPFTGRKW